MERRATRCDTGNNSLGNNGGRRMSAEEVKAALLPLVSNRALDVNQGFMALRQAEVTAQEVITAISTSPARRGPMEPIIDAVHRVFKVQ